MEKSITNWLFDPTVGKIIATIFAFIFAVVTVRFLQSSVSKYIQDTDTRYRTRKFISFLGYLLVFVAIGMIYSDKLGGLTVALGVAGAGIAFALQEVIASVAGWFAVTFAHFYKTGDRVQLGGIKGDVIDVGILRSTLMEVGEWVKGDLYTGRIVRIANSFVFKEPVFNYSGEFPFLWDEITFPIKYGSNFSFTKTKLEEIAKELVGEYSQQAEQAWENIVNKFLIEDAQVQPMVTVIADENWMTFNVRYVVDYKKRRVQKINFSLAFSKRLKNLTVKCLLLQPLLK